MLHGDEPTQKEVSGPAAQPSMVGRVLYERFLVEGDLSDETLGTGFSCWLVKDLKNFCREAIFKTASAPPSQVAGGPSFQQVCEVLMRLGHRNTEEILETGMLFDGRPYAVARPYPGRRLSDVIDAGARLELSRVAAIIEQLSEALAAVHAENVLHCDVRPGNVVFIDEGTISESVRLINFGSAWPVDVRGATLENLRSGSESLSYAAPELHSKLGHRTNASDIYSLSALAYRLITGRVPFPAEDRVSIVQQISVGQVLQATDLRTDLTNEAEGIILSGLRFEPAWRPQDVEDFGIRLSRSLRPARPFFIPEVPAPAREVSPAAEVPIETAIEELSEDTAEELRELRRVYRDDRPNRPVSDRTITWALLILLLAGALSIPISQTLMARERPAAATETILPRQPANRPSVKLRYWFDAAKSGRRGDLSRSAAAPEGPGELQIAADKPGSIFVIGESSEPNGTVRYRILYSATAAGRQEPAGEALRTGAGVSAGEGAEQIWVVWLPEDSREIEDLKRVPSAGEFVSGEAARKLRHFLERNRDMRVSESNDAATGHTILTGSGERIVHRIAATQVNR